MASSVVNVLSFLVLICAQLIQLSICSSNGTTIESWLNYQCEQYLPELDCNKKTREENSSMNLIYTKSVNQVKNETNHFVWSTIGGTPGFFVIQTSGTKNSDLHIDWLKMLVLKPRSIKVKNQPVLNTIGVLVSKIFFWELSTDDESFNPLSKTTGINLTSLSWEGMSEGDNWKWNNESSSAVFRLKRKVFDGWLEIRLDLASSLRRHLDLPHLLIDEKSMNVEVVLNGTKLKHEKTRVGIELTVLTTGEQMQRDSGVSFDDEYSPGVFKTIDIVYYNQESGKKVNESFVEWKPVSYSTVDRSVSQTLGVVDYVQNTTLNKVPTSNLPLYGLFSGLEKSSFQIHAFNITIGVAGEPYYGSTNYTTWAFVTGIGNPPDTALSTTLKIIILLGFGLPLIALVIAVSFIVVLKAKRRKGVPLLSEEGQ